MTAFILTTGPHPSPIRGSGREKRFWRVAVVSANGNAPIGKEYRCLSYWRAVSLSCHMARDRRLFLHMQALPLST